MSNRKTTTLAVYAFAALVFAGAVVLLFHNNPEFQSPDEQAKTERDKVDLDPKTEAPDKETPEPTDTGAEGDDPKSPIEPPGVEPQVEDEEIPEGWIAIDDSEMGDGGVQSVAIVELDTPRELEIETRQGRKGFVLPVVNIAQIWVRTGDGAVDIIGMVHQGRRIAGEDVSFKDQLHPVQHLSRRFPFGTSVPFMPLSDAVRKEGEVPVIHVSPAAWLRIAFEDSGGAPTPLTSLNLAYRTGDDLLEMGRLTTDTLVATQRDGFGTARIPVPAGVEMRLESDNPSAEYRIEPDTVLLESEEVQEIVVVDLAHSALHLRVVDPDGAPLPTAIAQVMEWNEERQYHEPVLGAHEADEQGRIRFAIWEDARFSVSVAAPAHHPTTIDLLPYAIHGEVTVTLARFMRNVKVRIVDGQGQPYSAPVGLRVNHGVPGDPASVSESFYQFDQSEYELQVNENAPEVFLRLESEEYLSEPRFIRLDSSNVATFTVTPLAVLEVTVEGAQPAEWTRTDGSVHVAAAGLEQVLQGGAVNPQHSQFDASTEWPLVFRVPAGSYRVTVGTLVGQLDVAELQLEGATEHVVRLGDPIDVSAYQLIVPDDISLEDGAMVVSGEPVLQELRRAFFAIQRVDDDDPVQGALQRILRGRGNVVQWVNTEEMTVEIPRIDQSRWNLAVSRLGKVPLVVNHHARTAEVVPGSYGTITGMVQDSDGKPANATVRVRSVLSDSSTAVSTSDFSIIVDDEGRYRAVLAPGTYDIYAIGQREGDSLSFTDDRKRIAVTAGSTIEHDFEGELR